MHYCALQINRIDCVIHKRLLQSKWEQTIPLESYLFNWSIHFIWSKISFCFPFHVHVEGRATLYNLSFEFFNLCPMYSIAVKTPHLLLWLVLITYYLLDVLADFNSVKIPKCVVFRFDVKCLADGEIFSLSRTGQEWEEIFLHCQHLECKTVWCNHFVGLRAIKHTKYR